MKVVQCPTDDLALTNMAIVNEEDFNERVTRHIKVTNANKKTFIFSIRNHAKVNPGEIAFSAVQRQWASLWIGENFLAQPFSFVGEQFISVARFNCDFSKKKSATLDPIDTELMARQFSIQFPCIALTVGQKLAFHFNDANGKLIKLLLEVESIEGIDLDALISDEKSEPINIPFGQLLSDSAILFGKAEDAMINLVGKAQSKSSHRSLINPDWDFQKLEIGGLNHEFTSIFRRAFNSRVFPPEINRQLGMKHVRGILLYGPPGTGKTLMARQIGKMLNAREPKIVNGPSILDKYVGESESNIRKLFADAEEEWKRSGENSALHMIIFDEIDAICKQRGSIAGSSGVHDTIVNQLLSKMDGVDQLNNILIIGMTNRKDMIDEALLRPGRLEVQVEISLPDEEGRLQILNIHTSKIRECNRLDSDVNLAEVAAKTKNFTGAEIEGLVRAATSYAMSRVIKPNEKGQVVCEDEMKNFTIKSDDFIYALENDIKPAFGRHDEALESLLSRGLIIWSDQIEEILNEGKALINGIYSQKDFGFVTALLVGDVGSGTSCIAAHIAKDSNLPFVKVIKPTDFIGFTEAAKCQMLKRTFEDAYRSQAGVLLIDSIERIVDYSRVGPRFSNQVLQSLMSLLSQSPPSGHRLLVIATSSNSSFLHEVELNKLFDKQIQVPNLTSIDKIGKVILESKLLDETELSELYDLLLKQQYDDHKFQIPIKRLLVIISLANKTKGDRVLQMYREIDAHMCRN